MFYSGPSILSGRGFNGVYSVAKPTGIFIPSPISYNASPAVPSSVSSLPFSSSGAAYIEYTDTGFNASPANSPIILCISQGTNTTHRIYIRKANTGQRMQCVIQNMSEIWQGYLNSYANGTHKILITWDATGTWFYIDGALICYINTGFTLPTGLDSVYVGRLNSGTANNYAPNSSADLTVWNVRLTDAQCRALTSNVQILSGITPQNKDIIAFLAQSNSSGMAAGTGVYINTSRMFKLPNSLSAITSYSDPYDSQTGAMIGALSDPTAALSFAGYVIDAIAGATGRDIVALPANRAGTCFLGTVAATVSPTWDNASALYRTSGSNIVGQGATITAAIQQLQCAKQFASLKGIIWQGNEGDVSSTVAVNQSAFEAKYPQVVNEIRLAIGQEVPWLDAGYPSNAVAWAPSGTVWTAIRDGKINAIANIPKSQIVSSVFGVAGNTGDGVHFNQAGIISASPAVSAAALNLFYGI